MTAMLTSTSTAPAQVRRPVLRSLRSDRLGVWHVAAAAFMGALGVLAMLPAWQEIYHSAVNEEENSQVFLVPLVCVYLVWVRRMRLRHCKPSFRLIGPIIVAAGWVIGYLGFYHDVHSFWHIGAVMVMVGCVLSVLGKNALFRFFPAFAVLVFLVTVPVRIRMAIGPPLEHWNAVATQHILELCGVLDVRVDGNLLRVNNVPVNVAEACNGLRLFFGLVLVCFAFGFGMPLRNPVRLLILLASPLTAVCCNVVRILATVTMDAHASPAVADAFHEAAGWAMLPIAFLILYGIIGILNWAMIPVTTYTLPAQTTV